MTLEMKDFNQMIGGRTTRQHTDPLQSLCQMVCEMKKEQEEGIKQLATLTGIPKQVTLVEVGMFPNKKDIFNEKLRSFTSS